MTKTYVESGMFCLITTTTQTAVLLKTENKFFSKHRYTQKLNWFITLNHLQPPTASRTISDIIFDDPLRLNSVLSKV